ncbi:MAG: beta-lactamase family protein [Bacteroidetes bacterium]|nr:beta-lactamase family protein [Bacteroidota bacterium]
MTTKKIITVILLILGLLSFKNKENTAQERATNFVLSTIGQNIDDYLTAMEAIGFSGAILVSHKDEVLLSKGYGYSDRENRISFTPKTVQSNGSNTKQFTGVAILLLESRNQLSVNDSLPVYFENVPVDKQQITLHQLLTHSSGLLQGVGYDDEPIEFAQFFERLMEEPLEFEPGTSYNYSNAGYSLLARIVEKLSGVNYETFIYENLLKPSGMMETGYIRPSWKSENIAIGYQKGKKWGKVYKNGWIEDGPNWHLRGNGGIHTTIEDMHKWLATVKGVGVLDKNAVEKWTTGYVTENNGYSKYGYGLVSYVDDKWGKVITHSGSNSIFTSHFFWLPERDFFFYIHGNNSIFPVYEFEENILKAAFDENFNFPPIVKTRSLNNTIEIKQKEGTYSSAYGTIELMADDSRFIAKLSGQETIDLMFKHNEKQKKKFAALNAKMKEVMEKLEKGGETPFKDIVAGDEASKKVALSFQNRILQMRRNLEYLNVIGTFENTPGSDLYEYGPYTTFVHARFENWNQYWNLVWNEDGTYNGNYSGPWPEFIMVPVNEKQFIGIRGTPPWNTVNNVEFIDECLKIENSLFCKIE